MNQKNHSEYSEEEHVDDIMAAIRRYVNYKIAKKLQHIHEQNERVNKEIYPGNIKK